MDSLARSSLICNIIYEEAFFSAKRYVTGFHELKVSLS
jgi:hypothetical protein